jgi:hypothetical protein
MTAALCARWDAKIVQRGGPTVWAIPPDSIVVGSLDHRLSDVAVVSLTLDGCAAPVAVTPWLHELHLARDGVATFAGPIVAVGATAGQLTVAAHDRMRWVMDRRRTAAAQGDAASVVRQLVEQADAQGRVGLDVHAAPQSTPYTSTNILIGSDIESSDARWTARAGILQVGAAPFASSGVTLTEADWDEPPAVFVDGLGYASTIIGDTTYHVSPGMWGERAVTLSQGDPRADYLARSTTWADTGETNGRGPRRLLSSATPPTATPPSRYGPAWSSATGTRGGPVLPSASTSTPAPASHSPGRARSPRCTSASRRVVTKARSAWTLLP